ncbi:hypothetical protein LUZ60_007626 [Juncus effusus]|nr:hypothetical protein LUZ60_007626 [Juncus effusus]
MGRFRGLNWVFLFSFLLLRAFLAVGDTFQSDVSALNALANQWQGIPSNWVGIDPCGTKWVGVTCDGNRVTSIRLSSIGIKGQLPGDIQNLGELQELDLSYNPGLTGSLPSSIGNLVNLTNLILVGCSFSGEIPDEIGKLSNLVFLSLNQNKFTGNIPATIGNLKKLYWLDLANNRLTGTIPVSDGTNPGLDLLNATQHFHFGVNQLSGTIPSKLFNSNMTLIHLLFESNTLTGAIPSTLSLMKHLEVIRLDKNILTGPVPNLSNLTNLAELHLDNNKLNGSLPDLTGLSSLSFVDMSNNSFDGSDVPPWFSTLSSLTSLYLEFLKIEGELPQALFSNSPLQTLKLKENRFNGTLDIGTNYSNQLTLIDLTNNGIKALTLGGGYSKELILVGNPVCVGGNNLQYYCKLTSTNSTPTYSTPKKCQTLPPTCASDQTLSPNCKCSYPYTGTLFFRSPSFSDLGNDTYYTILEQRMKDKFLEYKQPVDSVSLQNIFIDSNNYLEMSLGVFPSNEMHFTQGDISGIGFILSNQTYKPPKQFGPYYFLGQQYASFNDVTAPSKKSSSLPIIIGAAAGGAVLILILIGLLLFFIKRKKTLRPEEKSRSFSSWDPKSSSSIPQLKGARMFTFDEIKKCTNNFCESNDIGIGGYGKVYRGTLGNGQLVAVKRAQDGSSQGANEFRTEIELLSRVHHKNLVSLVGFCFEKGEQMLVYEYVANGTLKDSLSGNSGVYLDWRRRLRVAVGTAKGIAYLHELANPPIIHRDIKSSNVLLDDNLNAKVSDFGLSKPMGDDGKGYVSTQVKGTMGYLDPEYYMTQQLNEKSDVYSFGVLLLEILTGKKPLEKGRYVVREFGILLDRSKDLYNLKDLLDHSIGFTTSSDGIERYIDLAMQCVNETGTERPTMSEVVNELEKVMKEAGLNPSIDSASNSLSYLGSNRTPVRHPYRGEEFEYSGDPPYPR